MRRTKEWWARLTRDERSHLVYLENADAHVGAGGGWNLPDDCHECSACSQPSMSSGLCDWCSSKLEALKAKANDR
jgi:hypothetical protein